MTRVRLPLPALCSCDGTGRRSGLKIRRPQRRVGSTPTESMGLDKFGSVVYIYISIPRRVLLSARKPDFHSGKTGSIPVRGMNVQGAVYATSKKVR